MRREGGYKMAAEYSCTINCKIIEISIWVKAISKFCEGKNVSQSSFIGRDEQKRQQHNELLLKVTLPNRVVDKKKQIFLF